MKGYMVSELATATLETIFMVGVSSFIAVLVGIPLGVILVVTRPNHILPNAMINTVLGGFVNIVRSIPFIILIIALIPLTELIMHTYIGTAATILPLSIGAAPFTARLIEATLLEVDYGVIESAESAGASPWQIVSKVLISESKSGITIAAVITVITLVGYSAMAGTVGGGGLGDYAMRNGYINFDTKLMTVTVIIIIIMVQVLQMFGDKIAKALSHKV